MQRLSAASRIVKSLVITPSIPPGCGLPFVLDYKLREATAAEVRGGLARRGEIDGTYLVSHILMVHHSNPTLHEMTFLIRQTEEETEQMDVWCAERR